MKNYGLRKFVAGLVLAALFAVPLFGQAGTPAIERQVSRDNSELALIDDVEKGFIALFDGKSLDGWEQKNGTAKYEVVDGTVMGRTEYGSPNSFLCTDKEYEDFDLRFDVKVDEGLNSGVQIRSLSIPGFKEGRVHGPQVEIETDPGEAGYIYSEGTDRGWVSPTQTQKNVFKNADWNHYRVLADGPRIQTWINGTQIEDLEMPAIESKKGFIGLQVHEIGKDVGPFKVQWQNIRIHQLTGDETRSVLAYKGTPEIDGKIDDIWNDAPRILTSRVAKEVSELSDDKQPATAWTKCMWDDGHLYCLAVVKDPKIATDGTEAYERDSVEFFVDGNLSRGSSYDSDDVQYRTDADGKMSGGTSSDLKNYQSAMTRTDDGYIIEACINMDTAAGKKIGFDVQVNSDDGAGHRESTMKWNDSTNNSWQDISKLGTLEMLEKK